MGHYSRPQTHRHVFSARCHLLPGLQRSCISGLHPRGSFAASFQEPLELSHPILRRHWDLALSVHPGLAYWRPRSERSSQSLARFGCGQADGGTYTPCNNHHCNFVVFLVCLYHGLDYVRGWWGYSTTRYWAPSLRVNSLSATACPMKSPVVYPVRAAYQPWNTSEWDSTSNLDGEGWGPRKYMSYR